MSEIREIRTQDNDLEDREVMQKETDHAQDQKNELDGTWARIVV